MLSRRICSFNTLFKIPNGYACKNTNLRLLNTKKVDRSAIKNTLKYSLIGASVGAFVGVGYFFHNSNTTTLHVTHSEEVQTLLKEIPIIQPSRRIIIPEDSTGLKLTLYQYQTCPFCCKVRAFLDYYGISYDVVEVNPVMRNTIKWSKYKKVPMLVAKVEDGYQQMTDSSMIISALSTYIQNENDDIKKIVKFYPIIKYKENNTDKSDILNKYFLMLGEKKNVDTKKLMEEQKWRKWADNVLVHMLSPNVYRTQTEALQAFNWFSEIGEWEKHFASWERLIVIYVGAFAMWIIGKRLKKRHNLEDDVRQSLYKECDVWMEAINKKGTKFMGGDKPDLSDLAVYGILSSIEGCDAFQDLKKNSTIHIWFNNMKKVVKQHDGLHHI